MLLDLLPSPAPARPARRPPASVALRCVASLAFKKGKAELGIIAQRANLNNMRVIWDFARAPRRAALL